jgi:uncharacterized protein (DUF4415 family)
MRKVVAEKYRNIDFTRAKRVAIVPLESGKTKISIRLDNAILEYFRSLGEKGGGGNYQTLINEALIEHIHMRSTLEVLRLAIREELAPYHIAQAELAAAPGKRCRERMSSSGSRSGRGHRKPPSAE